MKKYKVAVTEIRRRVVLVEGKSEEQAYQRAFDAWYNGEINLEVEDYQGTEIYVVGEMDGSEDEKHLERIDSKDEHSEEIEVDKDGKHPF